MNLTEAINFSDYRDREKREEAVGILLAISVVSRRLAERVKELGERLETGCGEE